MARKPIARAKQSARRAQVVAGVVIAGHYRNMRAEHAVGLEGAMAELGEVYSRARRYVPLYSMAEAELLPSIEELGAWLRRGIRHGTAGDDEVEKAAQRIDALKRDWSARVEEIQRSALSGDVRAAIASGDGATLADRIPKLFVGFEMYRGPVFFPVSVRTGARKPGVSPFVDAATCVARIETVRTKGLEASVDEGLPAITGTDDPLALESPVALAWNGGAPGVVFREDGGPHCVVFAERLPGPFSVVLAPDSDDDWWETHEQRYAEFRDAVAKELKRIDGEGRGER